MTAILVFWAISAVVILALAVGLGYFVKLDKGPFGILIDNRGRFSLTHLQLVLWTIVIVSLISGIFFGRLWHGRPDPLNFSIPESVLGLLGISVGSAVTATAVKAAKKTTAGAQLATAAITKKRPSFRQVFLQEEGEYADEIIDVTKFQSFLFTLALVVAYVALAIHAIVRAKTAGAVKTLPDLSGTYLVLLGISHAAYVAGKLPTQTGDAPVKPT